MHAEYIYISMHGSSLMYTSVMYEAGDEEPRSMAAAVTTGAAAPHCLYDRRSERGR